VGLRPEALQLTGDGASGVPLRGTVEDEVYLGDRTEWLLRVGEDVLTVSQPARHGPPLRRGDAVEVVVPAEAVLRLDDPQDAA
jgi:ABC-type Fe3+/spermidine/putrescine transport system ATPase subunit